MTEPRPRTPLSSRTIVGQLADPARRAVVAALILGAHTPSAIAQSAGLNAATVTSALKRLFRSGLVVTDGDGFALREDVFAQTARHEAPVRDAVDFGVCDPAVAKVLASYLREGRLETIPVPGRKRDIVLDYLVGVFEPGRRFTEAEVNATLRAFHPDVAALRRYLVEGGLLARADGEYWRSGGTVDVS